MNNSLISENRLPSGWEFKNLKDITCSFKSGFSITSENISEDTTLFPVYGGNGLRGYTSTFTHDSAYTLIGRQGALCGNLNYVEGKSFISEHAIAVKANNENETKFLYYNFSRLNLNKLSEASAQPGLSVEKLLKLETLIPPLAEQRKIAQALTDADNYISALEKLIEKKKMMKEGLINRFFSNNQDWKELTLFDIAENNRSLFNDGDWIEAEYITSEGVRLIQTGNIGIGKYVDKEANKKYVSEASFQLLNCKVLKDQDILICRLAEPAGRACIFHATSEKTITSVDVTIFRPKTEKYNRNFLVYAMSMPTWFSKISENVGGTTHKRISRSNLGEITIKVPNLATQNRIAQILTTMDNQLDLLIGKLEKAKSIKIGMMQKLLTGEIRLA